MSEREGRLVQEVQELREQFSFLQEVSTSMMGTLELPEVLRIVGRAVLCRDEVGVSLIYRVGEGELHLEHLHAPGGWISLEPLRRAVSVGELGPLRRALVETRPCLLNPQEGLRPLLSRRLAVPPRVRSLTALPLLSRGEVRRLVLILGAHQPRGEALSRLALFGKQAELALDRALLYSRIAQEYKELEVLYRLSTKISSLMPLDEILSAVMEGIQQLVRYDVCVIGMLDEARERFEICQVQGLTERQERWIRRVVPEVSREFINYIVGVNLKEPRFIDVKVERTPPPIDVRDLRYFLNIPMISEDRLIGAISLGMVERPSLEDRSVKTLTIMASQVAPLLERAKKYQQEMERKEHVLSALSQEIKAIGETFRFDNIIGRNHRMRDLVLTVASVADTDAPVLIQGETGTGKELIAKAIHFNSSRRDRPFIKVNCGSIPENLLESEMFGHVRGAFTGAYRDRVGKFELADRGTLFLDEIGDLPLPMQVKLLRVLQDMEFEPVGSNRTKHVDVRVIAATNQDLEDLIRRGRFRKDLYYRLNVIALHIPPLRERPEDIPPLAEHFLRLYAQRYRRDLEEISPQVFSQLMAYGWPGNVRELENVIERAVLMARPGDRVLRQVDLASPERALEPSISSLRRRRQEFERQYIVGLLRRFRGNVTLSAQQAGLNRKTFYLKMRKYGIRREEFLVG